MKLVAYFLNKIYNFPDKGFGSLIKCKFTSFTGGFALVPCLHLWYNTSMCNRPYFMLLYLFHCLKVWFDFHVHIFVYIFVWKILTNSTIKRTYEICVDTYFIVTIRIYMHRQMFKYTVKYISVLCLSRTLHFTINTCIWNHKLLPP